MKILITGAGSVMGQSIYKALARHSFSERVEVHVANSDETGAAFYFADPNLPIAARLILPLARDERYSDALSEYVRKHAIDIVFSGTQHELAKVAGLIEQGIKCATLPLRVADLCLDKAQSMRVFNAHNVRVPQTQSLRDFLKTPDFSSPGIIKPNTSSASRRISLFDKSSDVKIEDFDAADVDDLIVQERLAGDEFTCGCYVDKFSGESHVITLKRTLTPDGATSFGEIVHDADIENYVRSAARGLASEGFEFGHINVQLIVDRHGPCLFEVNGRLSSTEAPKARFGFNSCAAYVVNLVDETAYKNFEVAPKGKFLRYYEEVYWE